VRQIKSTELDFKRSINVYLLVYLADRLVWSFLDMRI